jgi:hypothetical protein
VEAENQPGFRHISLGMETFLSLFRKAKDAQNYSVRPILLGFAWILAAVFVVLGGIGVFFRNPFDT